MEQSITFAGPAPTWERLQQEFAAAGLAVTVRMIDGLPAFPDESPSDGWVEVRVSLSGGMITLRQSPGRLAIVVWGNADENHRRERDELARACALAVQGTITSSDQS